MFSVMPPFAAEKPSRNSSLMEFSLQALLVRHEAYMADAEKERKEMMAQIEELESQKHGLQKTNESLVTENRTLLDQLESINTAVAESDSQVTNLQASLQSAHQEMQRLSQLASKTERLEQQLATFEREHEACQANLDIKEEAEKTATRRWQKSERALADMQDQLERIEQEAKEERERHVEVVGRMERRRAVEKELTSAAGRLKGAAASKTTGAGTNVVSHFVKDILQDNANLQMGIVELREMLQNSNEEVETLRQQLVLHQPLQEDEEIPRPPLGKRNISLNDELNRASSQELHVHHHYHAPPTPSIAASSRNTLRRPKKKRYGSLTPSHFTPPASGRSTPRSSVSYHTPSSIATILKQTAVSIPDSTPNKHRWSTQSSQTYQSQFSGPGSPQSTINRSSSIYDRVFSDGGHESSRPTTPDTEEPGSPMLVPTHKQRPSGSGFRTTSAPVVNRKGITPGPSLSSLDSIMDASVEELPSLKARPSNHHSIAEEGESDWDLDHDLSTAIDNTPEGGAPASDHAYFDINSSDMYSRPLRRAASHESLLSISGMDIHTYQTRPRHKLLTQGGVSSGTVVSSAQAHAARPAIATHSESNGHSLLRGVAADQRLSSVPKQTITRKASGWIFGRWGATPMPAVAESSNSTKSASIKSGSDRAKEEPPIAPKMPKLRAPGINQTGPIFGFPPEIKVQHPPVVKKLDQEELRNVLEEA